MQSGKIQKDVIKKHTIFTNIAGLDKVYCKGNNAKIHLLSGYVLKDAWLVIMSRQRSKSLLLNIGERQLLFFCALKYILPFLSLDIISVDILLRRPKVNVKDLLFLFLRWMLFKQVKYFVLYFKNTDGYEKCFGIKKSQLRYVPFKVNSWDEIQKIGNIDYEGDYVLCAGRTLRDVNTYLEAMRICGLPGILLVQNSDQMLEHGTDIENLKIPDNVTIRVHNDGEQATFLKVIEQAKIVVIPRFRNDIASTGISTYMCAMGMGRPVIISEGPGASDVLNNNEAVIVEPENSAMLSDVIILLWQDEIYRQRIAANGYAYAKSLKGEERLLRDLLAVFD